MPCPVASTSSSGSVDGPLHGLPAGQKCSAAGTGSASTVTVTVVQCINSGIDNDATSTMAQQVMCTCGIPYPHEIQANPHDASEKQGAQRQLRQNRQHYFLPPFALSLPLAFSPAFSLALAT